MRCSKIVMFLVNSFHHFFKVPYSSDLLDHSLKHLASTPTVVGAFCFGGWVLMQEKTNKKEKLKMGRRKRRENHCFNDGRGSCRNSKIPSRGLNRTGDICKKDWASSRVCCIAWFWLAAIGPKDSPTLQLMWPRQHKLLAAINISLVI